VKAALGPQRYAEFTRLQDPAYRDALTQAQANGSSPQAVQALYGINQATVAEQSLVQANSNLTDVQKQIELKKIELEQLKAQAQAQGQLPIETPPPTSPASVVTVRHTIVAGDTLVTIARSQRLRVSDIEAVNPGVNFHALNPGDSINLPVIVQTPPMPPQ
jgi:LysM repeat protein